MSETQNITVAFSKVKLLLLFTAGCGFVVGGYYMFNQSPDEIALQHSNFSPLFIHCVGAASVIFFGLCIIPVLCKLFDDQPGLVLNNRGLTENSNIFSVGFIPWSDIVDVEVHQISSSSRIIYILLSNPEKYVAACAPIKRVMLRLSEKIGPSPVAISSNALKISFNDLLSLLQSRIKEYRTGS